MGGVTLADMVRGGIEDFGQRSGHLIGLRLLVDPSLFILGEGLLRVAAPAPEGLVVGGIGRLAQSGRHTWRLYPQSHVAAPGERFVEIAASTAGVETRFFSSILTEGLSGAAVADWSLPPAGRLGLATLTTPGGDTYERVEPPGTGWVLPRTRYERVEMRGPAESRRHSGHLFARPTGAAEPAPAIELLWAETVECRAAVWVMLAAGVRIDPAAVAVS